MSRDPWRLVGGSLDTRCFAAQHPTEYAGVRGHQRRRHRLDDNEHPQDVCQVRPAAAGQPGHERHGQNDERHLPQLRQAALASRVVAESGLAMFIMFVLQSGE